MSNFGAGPCPEWELLLHAFFDGELDVAHSLRCEQHLTACLDCALEVRKLKAIRRAIAQEEVGWPAPAALRKKIQRI